MQFLWVELNTGTPKINIGLMIWALCQMGKEKDTEQFFELDGTVFERKSN